MNSVSGPTLKTKAITSPATPTGKVVIARKPCGCVIGAILNLPQMQREVAATLCVWERSGFTVAYMDGWVSLQMVCAHKKKRSPIAADQLALW